MRSAWTTLPALFALTGLAACTSAGGFSTGSIMGASAPVSSVGADAGLKVAPSDPLAQPIQVAWTSARAAKCGFYFDPAKLRGAYLAAEALKGATPEQMQSIERTYDATHARVAKTIQAQEDYCAKEKVGEIRADLTRHLAGDYSPTTRKREQDAGMLDFLQAGSSTSKVMDRNEVLFPSGGGHTSSPR